jgi:hypothetical protein
VGTRQGNAIFDGRILPMRGAEGWQLSNPPIFQLAALESLARYF